MSQDVTQSGSLLNPETDLAAAALLLGRYVERIDNLIRVSAHAQAAQASPCWIGAFLDRAALQAAAQLLAPGDPRYDEAGLRDMLAFARPEATEIDLRLSIASQLRRQGRQTLTGPTPTLVEAFEPARQERIGARDLRPLERLSRRTELWGEVDRRISRHLGWSRVVPLYTLGRPLPTSVEEEGLGAEMARIANAAVRIERTARDMQASAERLSNARSRRAVFADAIGDIMNHDHVAVTRDAGDLRHLFNELVEKGALRELSGRPRFRIWGL